MSLIDLTPADEENSTGIAHSMLEFCLDMLEDDEPIEDVIYALTLALAGMMSMNELKGVKRLN
jgi:hypothetical protein